MNRYLRVDINLEAIKKNFSFLKKWLTQPPESSSEGEKEFFPVHCKGNLPRIIGVVKADAYGHGALEVSKILQDLGIDFLATAYLEEAIVLREGGIHIPIVVFFEEPDLKKYIKYDLRPVIHNLRVLEEIERSASLLLTERSSPLLVHLKIDTGMGRLGFSPDEALEVIKRIINNNNLRLEGIMSHFSEAELSNLESAKSQLSIFTNLCIKSIKLLQNATTESNSLPLLCHIANSAAILNIKESWLSGVRPGLLLYGYLPGNLEHKELMPSMKVSTKLLAIRKVRAGTPISYGGRFITKRESLIGIIPVGYADGLIRRLSNKGYVLINGRRAPVVGRICMDLTMIDLTDIINNPSDNIEGREVILMGNQAKESITAKDIAEWADTIPYEILTTFGGLGKRYYQSATSPSAATSSSSPNHYLAIKGGNG